MSDKIREALVEAVAEAIYVQKSTQKDYVPWVDGGNSPMQNEARRIASNAIKNGSRARNPAPVAAPVAQEPVAIEVMQFQFKHPDSGETHTVKLTRDEVAAGLEDTLYEKLAPMVCQCDGDADHECGDYIHDFDLVAAPPAAEQQNAAVMPCGSAVANVYEAYAAGKKSAEQPDTVKVPRELLDLIAYALHGSGWFVLNRKLRAMLAGGDE